MKVQPLPESHYQTLAQVATNPSILIAFATSFLAFVALFHITVAALPAAFPTTKQKSWVLSLAASTAIVLGGLPLFVEFLSLSSTQTIHDLPGRDSQWANNLAMVFVGFLAADLVVGRAQYPDQIGLLTGWVHHMAYVLVVINCIKYEIVGGFLCFASILEMPTIVLALGHLHKPWRRDLLFGFL
ncbi:hypothetical protein BC831DRAFT_447144 [Entophlyctis helioformis]|nr:hypothetical protein BC831DRAFT_447144 [Entophlyctis helioformis]